MNQNQPKRIRRIRSVCTSVRIHTTLTFVWAALLVPTLLFWKSSILWVAFMSLYANVAGHWSARESALAKVAVEESDTVGASPESSES